MIITKSKQLLVLIAVILISCNKSNTNLKVENLRCEYLTQPIGLDAEQPRFSWFLKSDEANIMQQSYHIYVGVDSTQVANRQGDFWTKNVESGINLIDYDGKPLQPFTKYYWAVEITNQNGHKSNLGISSFETGMMKTSNWKGSWIKDDGDIDLKPAPYFRKELTIKKKVKKARAYITAAGLYELYINRSKIGNHSLDPIYTRFDKRNLYVTYDVTNNFNTENIALGVLLGNGWYNHQSIAVWDFHKAKWRNRPSFCLNIKVDYTDGTTETFTTDETWKTHLSPVIFNSIYTAEHVDARLEQPGWNMPNFDDSSWKNATKVEAPSNNIVAQALPPILNMEEIKPVKIVKKSDKKYLFDFGRNISGITKMKLKGKRGTIIRVTHSEQLDSVGNIDLSNIIVHYRPKDDSNPFQTDIYTLNGEGEDTFAPKFNYKGFQYAEVVSDKPIHLTKDNIVAIFMHTNVAPVGTINSSNEIVNKIWQATNASYLSNLFGYPTDCPQREKNGWTGDAHIALETGLYNFDGITVYEKWLDDHRDEQQPNGVLPCIIPTWNWGYHWANGPDWTSTIAIVPWELYQFYGDSRALKENYENIKKYVDYITQISPSGLTDWGLGDWVPVETVTPKELTSSIYYYVDATILSKAAKLLGKQKDYETYHALAHKIKNAINEKYLNVETGIYGKGYQTELSAPLYWGVVPDTLKSKVAKNLAERVIQDNKHINVGLLGTKTILGALSQNGYANLAYEVASQETFPSWGYWIKTGATTLYENWDINASADLSRNHVMFGAIGAWFYKELGGIHPDPNKPGFKHIILEPHFVNGLEYFNAEYIGPYGKIESKWKKKEDVIYYTAMIPPNSTATLSLQAASVELNGKVKKGENNVFKLQLNSGKNELKILSK